MTIRNVFSRLDTAAMTERWNEQCTRDSHIAGEPYRIDPGLVDALLLELEIEPEEIYDPPPSVVTAVIKFTELAQSAGVALRLIAALGRATAEQWQLQEPAVAQELLVRTQWVLSAWMVIVGSRALGELDRAAHFDEMTGLFNIRAFRRDLAAALHGSVRPVLVIYADIDGLKHINDTEGHEAGDALIKEFAGALSGACSGPGRRAYRWGGDEHALLLVGVTPDEADQVMRRTSETFDRFSWGLATAPEDGDSVSELMAVSDERMYAAKDARRKALWGSSRLLKYVANSERRFAAWRKKLEERARSRSRDAGSYRFDRGL